MLIHELFKKYPDIVPEEYPIILLDSKSAVCMSNNGNYTKHTRHISRRVNFVRNGDKRKIHNIYWYEGGLHLSYIANNNVGKNDLNTRMKYIMVSLEN